jgi:hypothetical protein
MRVCSCIARRTHLHRHRPSAIEIRNRVRLKLISEHNWSISCRSASVASGL